MNTHHLKQNNNDPYFTDRILGTVPTFLSPDTPLLPFQPYVQNGATLYQTPCNRCQRE